MSSFDSTPSPESPGTREDEIARAVARVQPLVERILGRSMRSSRLNPEDADDVQALVMLRLVRRLRLGDVDDLEAYTATLTRNALHDLVRLRLPEWTRMNNRLRFLVGRDARFATWSVGDTRICGLAAWHGRPPLRELPLPTPLPPGQPADELLQLLQQLGGPVELDTLVSLMMDACHVVELGPATSSHDPAALEETAPSQFEQVERREFMEALWQEIAALPPLQRVALLLNLRDHQGGNALLLFLLLGIADLEALAAAVAMSEEELTALWNELPLDDLAIAARLGIGRQKVINLRRSARQRLARRLPR
jgi:RNA polymerase sigma factor (sigma-70 family)